MAGSPSRVKGCVTAKSQWPFSEVLAAGTTTQAPRPPWLAATAIGSATGPAGWSVADAVACGVVDASATRYGARSAQLGLVEIVPAPAGPGVSWADGSRGGAG